MKNSKKKSKQEQENSNPRSNLSEYENTTEFTNNLKDSNHIPTAKNSEWETSLFDSDFYSEKEDELENKFYLKPREKLQIYIFGLLSFLFFSLLLLPYDKLLKKIFYNFAQSINLEYGQVELNFLNNSLIENVSLNFNEKLGLRASLIDFGIPLLSLSSNHQNGTIEFKNLVFFISSTQILAKKLELNLFLDNIKQPSSLWWGNIKIFSDSLILQNFHYEALDNLGIDLSKLEINKSMIELNFDQGKIKLDNSQILTNYFIIKFKGNIQLKENTSESLLNIELCLSPQAELEKKNAKLMGAFLLLNNSSNTEFCTKIKGSLLSPELEKLDFSSSKDPSTPSNSPSVNSPQSSSGTSPQGNTSSTPTHTASPVQSLQSEL